MKQKEQGQQNLPSLFFYAIIALFPPVYPT